MGDTEDDNSARADVDLLSARLADQKRLEIVSYRMQLGTGWVLMTIGGLLGFLEIIAPAVFMALLSGGGAIMMATLLHSSSWRRWSKK